MCKKKKKLQALQKRLTKIDISMCSIHGSTPKKKVHNGLETSRAVTGQLVILLKFKLVRFTHLVWKC